ncbi:MAG: ThiF family adenylyltransferase [Phycisphaerae bacterium]|nr:ThiF family adenylyltransferase [Phycisphaerae bacterium]
MVNKRETAGAGDLARYARQTSFEPLGEVGQRRLLAARVTLVGCGALGSVLAETLVRAGVGHLRIIDRDVVTLDNLQRQGLFDEDDVAAETPKAEAAAHKLSRINSTVSIDPIVADFRPSNAEQLCGAADLILDGTDNLATRFLINDVAVKNRVPWVFGACVAAEGRALAIIPGETACLRCIWRDPPPAGGTPTAETVGVLGAIVRVVAGFQAGEALKLLTGQQSAVNRNLLEVDLWQGQFHAIDVQLARAAGDCPCCQRGEYDFLTATRA